VTQEVHTDLINTPTEAVAAAMYNLETKNRQVTFCAPSQSLLPRE